MSLSRASHSQRTTDPQGETAADKRILGQRESRGDILAEEVGSRRLANLV